MSSEKKWNDSNDNELLTEEIIKVKKPKMYAVIILNDDFTPMEFVIWLIQTVFHKNEMEATRLMLDVHQKGRGVCGVFTFDIANTKLLQVKNLSQKHEHPLECVVEPI